MEKLQKAEGVLGKEMVMLQSCKNANFLKLYYYAKKEGETYLFEHETHFPVLSSV